MASAGFGTPTLARLVFPLQLNSIATSKAAVKGEEHRKMEELETEAKDSKIRLTWKGKDLFKYEGGPDNFPP